ncbi:MAG TPA: MGMT family protein [Candidatus Luteimonas excrementigallinarum]|nr:MGMT family protein [Candidatus Luteimonas excrementigallinarum]
MEAEAARERILAAVRAIGRGRTAGYGEVARRAGLPGRARLVARILAANDDPALPWHRVLRSDGRIAFEAGSAGWIEQAQRLRAEGVEVTSGRVRLSPPEPGGELDALLWGPGSGADPGGTGQGGSA